jgi:hypothetical protein
MWNEEWKNMPVPPPISRRKNGPIYDLRKQAKTKMFQREDHACRKAMRGDQAQLRRLRHLSTSSIGR